MTSQTVNLEPLAPLSVLFMVQPCWEWIKNAQSESDEVMIFI